MVIDSINFKMYIYINVLGKFMNLNFFLNSHLLAVIHVCSKWEITLLAQRDNGTILKVWHYHVMEFLENFTNIKHDIA